MSRSNNELLVDGYISRAFSPKSAEEYLSNLLKTKNWKELYMILPSPSGSNMVFAIREASPLLQPPPFMRDRNGVPLDYVIKHVGTVVPQTLWAPQNRNDFRQHVEEADLQLPIFFIHKNGSLGLSLEDAVNAASRGSNLRDAGIQAQLGGKTTTHIRIWVGSSHLMRLRRTCIDSSLCTIVVRVQGFQATGANPRRDLCA